ncbi:MAG TPA: right-handed parallel beta-helix repeat-containing protein, partial [Candidatus Hydrogenedentes bacterium]|nr:right-handed parallel beta-helix repeat-containing protein [Candidatus Hydrogenedentota bacterium]
MRRCVLGGVAAMLAAANAFGAVWYVDKGNTEGPWDGMEWAKAYQTIQEGVDAAEADYLANGGTCEVWVAEGVYGEARSSDPHGTGNTGSVMMAENVHLYGGFVGTETAREQRNWQTHVTTIDGSTARDGSAAYHVIVGANNVTLDGFTITGGNANGGGALTTNYAGGMYNSSSSPTLTNCTFLSNSASHGGGGMWNFSSSSSPTVTNCTFSGNSADYGGGMYNDWEASPTLTNCTFSANSAGASGGGMRNYRSSSPTLTNCTFSNNSASQGGGMWNDSSSATLTNCTFSANSAGASGGGMYNTDSSPTVINCTFSANSASSFGGGMCNGYSSSLTLTNCTFSSNSAGDSGGGMYNYDSSSPTLTNCTFSANSASSYGGGMCNRWGSSLTLTNCTFSNNSADRGGGGMHNESSSPTLTNCILAGDSPDEMSNSSSAPVVTYSCVEGGYPGERNIAALALFVDASSGDLRLRAGSPCIDSGTSIGAPATDIRDVARPQGAGVDMGAYEMLAAEFPADTDGDGLPDAEEAAQGCDPDTADAALFATIDYPSAGASFRTAPIMLSGRISSAYVDLVVISTDGGALYYKVASIEGLTWSYSWSPSSAGAYTLQLRASNVFGGYTDSQPITMYYRPEHPVAVITSPVTAEHLQGSMDITGTGAETPEFGFSDYEVSYRAGADATGDTGWTTLTTSSAQVNEGVLYSGWDVSGLAEGPYAIRLRVTDASGYVVSATHVVVEVDHDIEPPAAASALAIEGGVFPAAVANGHTVHVSGNAEPDTFVESAVVVNQSGVTIKDVTDDITLHFSGSVRGTFTLPDSVTATSVALRSIVRDAVGNVSDYAQSNALEVDNAGPVVTIGFPLADAILPLDLIVVSGVAEDVGGARVQNVEFSLDGAAWSEANGADTWAYDWVPTT